MALHVSFREPYVDATGYVGTALWMEFPGGGVTANKVRNWIQQHATN